jgi:class 3 adenylate cyclase
MRPGRRQAGALGVCPAGLRLALRTRIAQMQHLGRFRAVVAQRRNRRSPRLIDMLLETFRVSISLRRKLASILLAVTIFALLAGLSTLAKGRPVIFGVLNAVIVGTGIGLFEQFYVQSLRGRWFRGIHPLLSILIYTAVVVVLFVVAVNLTHLLLYPWYRSSVPYRRLPFVIPNIIAYSVVGIVVMRVVHFVGIDTLFHLTIGTYHRPVIEQKVLMFLDINNSTGLAEELGALKIKALVGKFLFDVAKPITDNGGDIYLYKGDGLIAIWDWREAVRGDKILRAIDAVFAAVRREGPRYLGQFGVAPSFRIGVHGGDVVVSEQGDTKRSIGIYGSTINIASHMEDAAKAHDVACAISGDVARALSGAAGRLRPIGADRIKGIATEIPIFEYVGGGAAGAAAAAGREAISAHRAPPQPLQAASALAALPGSPDAAPVRAPPPVPGNC